ncbi:MAG TPA: DUF3090 domain-containing protein [Dermatophilaceae bacterium]|nr:DUF3090 domain-containing protein [Dermatophilaceae bacterium]
MALIDYSPPERFVAGTVGPPGQRQFFLQARGAGRTTSVALEKTQVSILADRVNDLLDDFAAGAATEQQAGSKLDMAPLDTPIEAEFVVGTMGLSWDPERTVIIIECHAAGDSFDTAEATPERVEVDPAEDPEQLVLRVCLSPAEARAFARRSAKVVAAGRPPCPFCAGPLDPTGHICPRANGYRR